MRIYSLALVAAGLVAMIACDEVPGSSPCPNGTLRESDLPCECQGAVVEELDCGDVSCGPAGLEFEYGADDCDTFDTDS